MEYKYFGLIAVIILILGLAFVAIRWSEGKHLTFSQHVAKHKHRIIYYNLLFTFVLPLLLLFFLGWFIPTFGLSAWFGFFIAASSVAQYVCTLIPEVGGWKTRYHRLLAGISAILLMPVQLLLLAADTIGMVDKAVVTIGLCIMVGIIFLIAINNGEHKYFLLLQSLYFGAFFVPILFVAYA